MLDPITGAGFDAPPPEVAYMGVTNLTAQIHAFMTRTANNPPDEDDPAKYREFLLHRAALADLAHLEELDNEEAHTYAVKASQDFIRYDRQHPEFVNGPIGPGSPEWDPSARPYVRQEWATPF
ncbi:hypothetical protein [Streptomyces albireticuli]|uniref:Uncharacterized protein n=1 Tax=Streptomyces albireticuli TaxID=1940 RepID=A0A2A2D943_9ACTN|nr:hypothetical protein [Streptomyces albireticuli]MCD9145897.1 hypothetical protein [Streptomyces albireticuli]MCD9166067.1 hypothetical protein [Streptomyces albireticuli]MCD9196347.1 hypothetical protein [Streptomyces albireticuli]PAU47967.1 hypothetical protein CK936_15775 [Streptomyces albireticuli]